MEEALENKLVLKRLFVPEMRKGACVLVEGETSAEAGRNLARRLVKDSVL
jgi:hypothetical protein